MDTENNWDLFAVVRGCRGAATRDPLSLCAPKPPDLTPAPELNKPGAFMEFSSKFDATVSELQQLCRPFFFPELPSVPQSSAAFLGAASVSQLSSPQPQSQPRALAAKQIPRSKRRKNQQKRVVRHVPAESISSDIWAWRKYGQKPIKGSPYPRGYYKCSSSKSCPARKLVERCRTDPNIYIVTYTAEHSHAAPAHRNALAGVARPKFACAADDGGASSPVCSPPVTNTAANTTAGLSPNTPLVVSTEGGSEEGDDEEMLGKMGEEESMLFCDDFDQFFEDEGDCLFGMPAAGEEVQGYM